MPLNWDHILLIRADVVHQFFQLQLTFRSMI
jgi:hypothetical protein